MDYPIWPKYDDEHRTAVARVIVSNQLFAAEEVAKFEQDFSAFTGSPYAIGCMNATAGLHLALAACNVGVGDEVIVTSYSWISTASCILMQNAIPIFSDISDVTLAPTADIVRGLITDRTKAVIVTHIFGYPAEIRELAEFCRRNRLHLIEDCSHAPGLWVDDIHVGLHGDIGVFSLHQRKAISVGDGCIIITKHEHISERIRRLRSFGLDELSYNFRMTEFAAALGRVGLSKLRMENERRREIAASIFNAFRHSNLFRVRYNNNLTEAERPVYYSLLIQAESDQVSDALDIFSKSRGLPVRRTWQPLFLHPHFSNSVPSARGRPWTFVNLPHNHPSVDYANLTEAPTSMRLQQKLLFEVLINPLFSQMDVANLISELNDFSFSDIKVAG